MCLRHPQEGGKGEETEPLSSTNVPVSPHSTVFLHTVCLLLLLGSSSFLTLQGRMWPGLAHYPLGSAEAEARTQSSHSMGVLPMGRQGFGVGFSVSWGSLAG